MDCAKRCAASEAGGYRLSPLDTTVGPDSVEGDDQSRALQSFNLTDPLLQREAPPVAIGDTALDLLTLVKSTTTPRRRPRLDE